MAARADGSTSNSAANRYTIVGIICSAEPIMTKWKWVLAARLPGKVFVLNENGDYFWIDRGHLANIRYFVLFRAGLTGAGAVRTLARVVLFPFSLLYLILYALTVHLRRSTANAMKAVFVEQPGGVENLKYADLPKPAPGPGQALVKIAASGVNYIDIYFRKGLYPAPPPIVLGSEGAGPWKPSAPT